VDGGKTATETAKTLTKHLSGWTNQRWSAGLGGKRYYCRCISRDDKGSSASGEGKELLDCATGETAKLSVVKNDQGQLQTIMPGEGVISI